MTHVVNECAPGPGLSCARRGTDIHGEWDRFFPSVCGPLACPSRPRVVWRAGMPNRPNLAAFHLQLCAAWGSGVTALALSSPARQLWQRGRVLPWVGRAAPPPRSASRPTRGTSASAFLVLPERCAQGCLPRCLRLSGGGLLPVSGGPGLGPCIAVWWRRSPLGSSDTVRSRNFWQGGSSR